MKQLAFKFSVLMAIVIGLQVAVFERLHRSEPLKKFERCMASGPNVIYFCDSCNAWIDQQDFDRRTISELLDNLLVDKRVGRIDGGAYHLELFEAFVDLLIARNERPDLLIIPVNLRSFSTEWDARPSYAFDLAKQQIRRADNRWSLAIGPLLKTLQWEKDATNSLSEFKRASVFDGDQVVGTVEDFENPQYDHPTPELVRNKFIFHYMYALQSNHRKLVAMRKIAAQAFTHDLRVVFYIAPVDYQTGNECLGERFSVQLTQNVAVIRRALDGFPATLIDCSLSLDSTAFSWHQYPNEHLNEAGRASVAEDLSRILENRFAFNVDRTLRIATRDSLENRVD